MGKPNVHREVTDRDVNCLENLVVAYNTVFLMSSIFIVSVAGTAQNLFSDVHRLLSPSALLLMVGGFIVLIAALGYIGVGKKSSSIISIYTLLLIFVFVMEVAAGLGILSFRGEIRSMISSKMKKAISAYPEDQMTANLVDYVQLELRCCGVNSYWDWDNTFDGNFVSNCRVYDIVLPQSCCSKYNSSVSSVNSKGCLPVLNFMLHRSSILLSTTIIAICLIQILGAYFAYSLSSSLNKLKAQKLMRDEPPQYTEEAPLPPREKANYF